MLCLGEDVIHNDLVELVGKGQLELRPCDALVDYLRGIRAATLQPLAQLGYRRWLDKQAQGLVAILLLDVHATLHVDIEHHVLSRLQLTLHL